MQTGAGEGQLQDLKGHQGPVGRPDPSPRDPELIYLCLARRQKVAQ